MTTEPDHINAEGFKWWRQPDMTQITHDKGVPFSVWVVESPKGVKEYVTLDKFGTVRHTTQQLEAWGIWIDIQKFLKESK